MDIQNDGLEKVHSFNIWPFLVSMLDFWGVCLATSIGISPNLTWFHDDFAICPGEVGTGGDVEMEDEKLPILGFLTKTCNFLGMSDVNGLKQPQLQPLNFQIPKNQI